MLFLEFDLNVLQSLVLHQCRSHLLLYNTGFKNIKEKTEDDGKEYIDGKPDYADVFEDNQIFCWDTQIGRGIDSSYTQDVMKAYRKHLMVKKSDVETTFYYMGQFDIVEVKPAKKLDNKGKERDIAKFRVKMRHAVRDDLLQYLESNVD